jgi:hypothetical protein
VLLNRIVVEEMAFVRNLLEHGSPNPVFEDFETVAFLFNPLLAVTLKQLL